VSISNVPRGIRVNDQLDFSICTIGIGGNSTSGSGEGRLNLGEEVAVPDKRKHHKLPPSSNEAPKRSRNNNEDTSNDSKSNKAAALPLLEPTWITP